MKSFLVDTWWYQTSTCCCSTLDFMDFFPQPCAPPQQFHKLENVTESPLRKAMTDGSIFFPLLPLNYPFKFLSARWTFYLTALIILVANPFEIFPFVFVFFLLCFERSQEGFIKNLSVIHSWKTLNDLSFKRNLKGWCFCVFFLPSRYEYETFRSFRLHTLWCLIRLTLSLDGKRQSDS